MAEQLGFYNLDLYHNTRYALNITLHNYFANMLFNGDVKRTIYSSTQFAFRTRSGWANNTSGTNPKDINFQTLDFPFLNFRINKVVNSRSPRKLWKHFQNKFGVYIPELNRKIRYTPIDIDYDCTLFYHRDDELQYGFDELAWDNSSETKVYPELEIDGNTLPFTAFVSYNLDYEPQYNETTALKMNNIHSISLNPTITTILLKDNFPGANYCITKKLIMEFATIYDLDAELLGEETIMNYIYNQYNESVTAI